jgi:molecular chaperone DnaK
LITIGIDLGTTNTVSAAAGRVFELDHGTDQGPFLPSAVAFLPGNQRLIGAAARQRYPIDPRNTILSAKRLIGRRWGTDEVTRYQSRYPYELAEQEGYAAFVTRAGPISPVEIAALVIARKLADAGQLPGSLRAVIAVPSQFGPQEREATRRAAEMAGLRDTTILEEPVATAMTYLQSGRIQSRRCMVYDLGGGTFDLALVDCTSRPVHVVARGGDLYLGGDDLDRSLAEHVARQLLERERWDLTDRPEVFARLVMACEHAKVRLCYSRTAQIDIAQVDPAAPVSNPSVTITHDAFERLALALIQRTFVVCDELLHRTGLRASDIDEVFLAGGSTQMELVRTSLEQYFGRDPRCDYDPMEVIGIGASLVAADIYGQ